MGNKGNPQLQKGAVNLGDDLPGQGFLAVSEKATPFISDELELRIVIAIKDREDAIILYSFP